MQEIYHVYSEHGEIKRRSLPAELNLSNSQDGRIAQRHEVHMMCENCASKLKEVSCYDEFVLRRLSKGECSLYTKSY